MTKMVRTQAKRRSTAALTATVAVVALFASACSSDSDKADSDKTATTSAASATSSAASATSASSTKTSDTKSTGSSDGSSASVDGKQIEAKFDTNCAKADGTTALSLVDSDNATYGILTASATIDESGTVQTAGISGTEGGSNGVPYTVAFVQGVPGGSASVEQDGNTFKVTGEGIGVANMTSPTALPTLKFDITFACSSVAGS